MSLRRKGPKDLPKLPSSLFTPPNTSVGDSFNLPPSPGLLHPAKIIDAQIVTKDVKCTQWKQEVGGVLADKTVGVVISLPEVVHLGPALEGYVIRYSAFPLIFLSSYPTVQSQPQATKSYHSAFRFTLKSRTTV